MDESELQSIPLFESLSRDERRLIAQHTDDVDVSEGTKLVRQGEFAYEFFVIVSGAGEVTRDGEHVAAIGPGDFLGEMGIVGKAVRNATVTATADSRVIVMSAQAFQSIRRSKPAIAGRIEAAVEERCRALVA